MKTNEFVVLEGHDIFIVRKSRIEEQDYYSLFDSNGRQFGHEYAGDYSIFNKQCRLYDKAVKEGVRRFGKVFESIRFWVENEEIKLSDFNGLDIGASPQEVAGFLLDIEREESEYRTRKAITWFNGQKWRSVVVGAGMMPYDKESGKEIIEDYLKALDGSGKEDALGHFAIRGDKYRFLEPKVSMFYEAKIERTLVSISPYTLKIKEGV